jgi:DNA-binding NarL/FixJ family response regulator
MSALLRTPSAIVPSRGVAASRLPLEILEGDPSSLPRVVVLGFGPVLGLGLRSVLADSGQLTLVGEPADKASALQRSPDVVLINGDASSTMGQLRRLLAAYATAGIVVAVSGTCPKRDRALLDAGASVVVPMSVEPKELCRVLWLVGSGLVASSLQKARTRSGLGALTDREAEVAELLAERRTAREIASALSISVTTVNTHASHIYEKLGVHSRAELALRWSQPSSA